MINWNKNNVKMKNGQQICREDVRMRREERRRRDQVTHSTGCWHIDSLVYCPLQCTRPLNSLVNFLGSPALGRQKYLELYFNPPACIFIKLHNPPAHSPHTRDTIPAYFVRVSSSGNQPVSHYYLFVAVGSTLI